MRFCRTLCTRCVCSNKSVCKVTTNDPERMTKDSGKLHMSTIFKLYLQLKEATTNFAGVSDAYA